MDAVIKAWVILGLAGTIIWGISHQPPETPLYQEPYHQEPLCRDPFTSVEMKEVTYTWCKLVPMWSTKA